MNSDSTITISLIIAIIGCLIGVYGFVQSYKKSINDDNRILFEIKSDVQKANGKLDTQCSQIQDIKVDLKSQSVEVEKLREKMIKMEINQNAQWECIDEIKEVMNNGIQEENKN